MSILWAAPRWESFAVTGPDSASWLHGILTCDVKSVETGHGGWGLLLNKQGKIQADLQLVKELDRLVLGVRGGNRDEVYDALDGYLVMEDAELAAEDRCWLVGVGDEASSVLQGLGHVPHRMPWTGPSVFASLITEAERQNWQQSWASEQQWQECRVKNGWFQWGVDFSASDNPHAAALERRTVDWSKGCYLGQEVVCMQDMRGKVKRRLAVLSLPAGIELTPGAEVMGPDGQQVGAVTSAALGWAIARLQVPFDQAGTKLTVGELSAIVTAPQ
jgi:folate-binding protein YgfZ